MSEEKCAALCVCLRWNNNRAFATCVSVVDRGTAKSQAWSVQWSERIRGESCCGSSIGGEDNWTEETLGCSTDWSKASGMLRTSCRNFKWLRSDSIVDGTWHRHTVQVSISFAKVNSCKARCLRTLETVERFAVQRDLCESSKCCKMMFTLNDNNAEHSGMAQTTFPEESFTMLSSMCMVGRQRNQHKL
jgi:hypothetical protein